MANRDRVVTAVLFGLSRSADRVLTTYMARGFVTCGDLLVLGEKDLGRLPLSPGLLLT